MSIDENQTTGLSFNGVDQYLKLTDGSEVGLGNKVPLRSLRTIMLWARFDAFTQNAKLFDFGNGKGKDNFFLGILGKGDPTAGGQMLRSSTCEETTVPTEPSGAQRVPEMSPQTLMETTSANVNDYECKGFEVYPRKLQPSFPSTPEDKGSETASFATLIYEVWEKEQRRMRMKINGAIPLGEWVHICIAATNSDAFRPNLAIYINGEKVLEKESGFLPAASKMTSCYIGKSNWANTVSKYENRDELFKGALFDFRMYSSVVSEQMIQNSYTWGKENLGLE
jgi:hypothetical protein